MPNIERSRAEDAKRLRQLIKRWQAARKAAGLPHRLSDLGVMVGGISQSAVSQYQSNLIPLNMAAVRLFASALGVTPIEISPRIAREALNFSAANTLKSTPVAGMVYDWSEMASLLGNFGKEYLPDVFSVELPSEMMGGVFRAGDIAVLSKTQRPCPGDGAIIRLGSRLDVATCWRGKQPGAVFAQLADGTMLDFERDAVELLFLIVGMPTLRWSRLARWRG